MAGDLYVLLHSPLTGAVAWLDAAAALAAAGVAVAVPEVTDDDRPPYAERYAAAVARQVDAAGRRVVLVPHSGAGALAPLVAHRLGAAAAVVYADAMLPGPDGATRLELLAREGGGFADGLREHLAAGGRFPDWSDGDLRDEVPDAARRAALVGSLRPRPAGFFEDPVPAPAVPWATAGYLRFSPAYESSAQAAADGGMAVLRLAARHFAPLADPGTVAASILTLGPPRARTSARTAG